MYTNNRKMLWEAKTGERGKKFENFEFVEVENMIKVHDEINFFQYLLGEEATFFLTFILLGYGCFDSNYRLT